MNMDRRYLKTEKAIQDAFFSLVKEKNTRITVTEIARRANIDRKTFYLHYDTPEDVLTKFCEERLGKLDDILQTEGFLRNQSYIAAAFSILNEVLSQDMDIYKNISDSIFYNFFWEQVENTFKKAIYRIFGNNFVADEDEISLMLEFYTSGIIAIYRKSLSGELTSNMDVMAEQLALLSMKGISGYMSEKKQAEKNEKETP